MRTVVTCLALAGKVIGRGRNSQLYMMMLAPLKRACVCRFLWRLGFAVAFVIHSASGFVGALRAGPVLVKCGDNHLLNTLEAGLGSFPIARS